MTTLEVRRAVVEMIWRERMVFSRTLYARMGALGLSKGRVRSALQMLRDDGEIRSLRHFTGAPAWKLRWVRGGQRRCYRTGEWKSRAEAPPTPKRSTVNACACGGRLGLVEGKCGRCRLKEQAS